MRFLRCFIPYIYQCFTSMLLPSLSYKLLYTNILTYNKKCVFGIAPQVFVKQIESLSQ